MAKLLLIDGHSILNRAFYGLPDLTNSEGLHTNAVYGFINIMLKILEEEKADYLTVAFDRKEPTFRHQMYTAYKGTRKPMPAELHEQVPLMKDVLRAMGIRVIEMPGYEADDLLGTLAGMGEREGMDVTILSGDRDLLQLATEKVLIRIPKTKKTGTEIENYYAKDVLATYGVTPKEFIDLKALMGDTADNIPGAPGIGEKTATAIITTYHSVEGVYEHLEEVKPPKANKSLTENREIVELSKRLATIHTDAPVEYDFQEAKVENIFTKEAYDLFKRLELKSILKHFEKDVTKSTDVDALRNSVTVLTDFQEVLSYLDKLSGQVGISLYQLEDGREGVIVSTPEGLTDLPCCNFVTMDVIASSLRERLDDLTLLCLQGKKLLLLWKNSLLNKELSHVKDLGIAAYLLNPLKDTYSYDDLARDYLQEIIPSMAELKKNAPDTYLYDVAWLSAHYARLSYGAILEELEKTSMKSLYEDIEMPLVAVLLEMEQAGMKVQKDELEAYGKRLEERILTLEEEIIGYAGESFNLNSPKQLGEILFEKMGLQGGKKTKTGYSTSAEALEKIKNDHPIIPAILEYRQLAKLKSTYADGLASFIGEDGRIHSTFQQTITATGRISSTDPNLQNIPVRMELGRQIRKCFIPEEDYVYVDADYSQIELRLLAHLSGDKNLIEAYNTASDIHAITASKVFGVPLEKVDSNLRRNAKAVNFGIVYGISAFGLSQDLNVSRKEAQDFITQYFETFPGIQGYLKGLVEEGKKQGYVTTMYGRRRPIPELSSSNFMQRSFGERIAMNSPIQGTAADLMKKAMISVFYALKEKNLRARIVLQVHDELMIETHKEDAQAVAKVLRECMQSVDQLSVPLEVDMHTAKDWYDAK
ncbi:MAG: DNA polymerase I [Lachnospiraceae bacterium]|nr:DNA polymerase I [Lachnospiraceae bacterium]